MVARASSRPGRDAGRGHSIRAAPMPRSGREGPAGLDEPPALGTARDRFQEAQDRGGGDVGPGEDDAHLTGRLLSRNRTRVTERPAV